MARSRLIANCWSIWEVWMKVALLVCTVTSWASFADLGVEPVVVRDVEADRVGDADAGDAQRARCGYR